MSVVAPGSCAQATLPTEELFTTQRPWDQPAHSLPEFDPAASEVVSFGPNFVESITQPRLSTLEQVEQIFNERNCENEYSNSQQLGGQQLQDWYFFGSGV